MILDTNNLNCYQLGVRIMQAIISHKRRVDGIAINHALIRLRSAYLGLTRSMDLGPTAARGHQLIDSMTQTWEWASNPQHEITPYAPLDIEGLQLFVRRFLQSMSDKGWCCLSWFDLGLEIAQAYHYEPRRMILADGVQGRRVATKTTTPERAPWCVPDKVNELCKLLEVPLSAVLPEVESDAPYEKSLPNLPDFEYSPAWICVEAGLENLARLEKEKPARRRPKWARDHQFLDWYDDTTSDTCRKPAKIAKKWNALHSDQVVTGEVVKKGIKKARKERESN
jgi:hypothetical protein